MSVFNNKKYSAISGALFLALVALSLVFGYTHNANVRGKVTAEGKPLRGVSVSDGVQIVHTNAMGRYKMYSDKADSVVFITTPSGYAAECGDSTGACLRAKLTKDAGKVEFHDFKLKKQ